ncbi:MAG: radical SAM protein, partial [Candidatus Omnitrophica bacterium]|nr:radical SAM protein [Candidatus Omnitrophota bacterium]
KDILREIKEALDKGITKITLLGQNVNSYCSENREKINFAKLLELVNRIEGIKEFSFITSHPKDTSVELFRVMASLGKLKKSLHLPIQSGSDRILAMMNRGYTKKFYLELVTNYRKIVKDSVLSTDIIVGYPQETDKDFQETFDLVKDIEFDAAYIFKYSARPNTKAAELADDLPRAVKEKRHKIILDLQKGISKKKRC